LCRPGARSAAIIAVERLGGHRRLQMSAAGRLALAPTSAELERRSGGSMILRSSIGLSSYPRCIGEHLERWARTAPERVFLAEREGHGAWRRVTYRETLQSVRAIGAGLLSRGLSVDHPVAILSDNSINHALLTLAAMHVGVPVAPISSAYSLMSKDFAKLKSIVELLEPGLVYVEHPARFASALQSVDWHGAPLVIGSGEFPNATKLEQLLACTPGEEVERAYRSIGPDTIAKILFTSGSTGQPKGVINTQRMLCVNQQQLAQVWPFVEHEPPIICDWLPWNHTFGANHNFNLVLRNGGTLYIDEGRPAPALIERTVENLREISPTLYFNVPRGFDMLVPQLESDAGLRARFFRNLEVIFYAGAALPQNLWERLEALSLRELGRKVFLTSGWGSTETAPLATAAHFPSECAGVLGIPVPGCELKMVENAGKLELRVRGPNVTPGYWKREDLTRAAFDEEGFYCIGDAGRFVDPARPSKGILFDGRVAEDFKLMSGTWVHVGNLRVRAIAALDPIAQDVVVAGHDRENVGLLVFPGPACRAFAGLPPEAAAHQIVSHPAILDRVHAGLSKLAHRGAGTSTSAARALLLEEPPSIDAGEITDKGYINQRAVLARRASIVESLYCEPAAPDVVVLGQNRTSTRA
jgi:feruloyl-CoA synthase